MNDLKHSEKFKEYIKDTEHLSEEGTTIFGSYAEELGVKLSDLWTDILSKNPFDVVAKCETVEDARTLLTKYKKETALSSLTKTMEMIMPGIGMSIQRSMDSTFKSKKKTYEKTYGFPKYCECGARLKVNDDAVVCRKCGTVYH